MASTAGASATTSSTMASTAGASATTSSITSSATATSSTTSSTVFFFTIAAARAALISTSLAIRDALSAAAFASKPSDLPVTFASLISFQAPNFSSAASCEIAPLFTPTCKCFFNNTPLYDKMARVVSVG